MMNPSQEVFKIADNTLAISFHAVWDDDSYAHLIIFKGLSKVKKW